MEIKILNATRMEMRIEIINGDENKESKILPKSDSLPSFKFLWNHW